jgi:hypothetical protein
MEGYIYLTQEFNSDGEPLKHNGLEKMGIGKSINTNQRFLQHHNKGSKSTIGMNWLNEFFVSDMDFVETELHRILKSLGYYVVNRVSVNGDTRIESRTEVFSGTHIDTNEEITEKLIFDILKSIVSGDEYIKITNTEFSPHFLQDVFLAMVLDAIENGEEDKAVIMLAELCARFGKTLTYLELFRLIDNDIMIIPSFVHTVFTSFEKEIVGKYNDENIGKWSNFKGFKIIDTLTNTKWKEKFEENLGKNKMIVFISIQTRETSFEEFDIIKNVDNNRKFILVDEADMGAWTSTSQKIVDYIS